MANFGIEKVSMHEQVNGEQVPHALVPGRAYEIEAPTTKLIHMVGGGYFNEPRYYDVARSSEDFYAELLRTGHISSVVVDRMGLSSQAREVMEAAVAVAESEHPEHLLIVAAWARDPREGLRLRSTPQVLLAIAAAHAKTRPFVALYGPSIMKRADEIRQVFGIYRHLFMGGAEAGGKRAGKKNARHQGSLPHCLRKALALALVAQSDASLLKYNRRERPSFADVLKMVGGSKQLGKYLARVTGIERSHWPLSQAMHEYLVNGKYVDDLPPILEARRKFFKETDVASLDAAQVAAAGLTWENVISELGASSSTWELCIPMMGEMALTRNLRNFEEAEISEKAWDQIYATILGKSGSVQLPFRYFTASEEVSGTRAKTLLGLKLDRVVAKLPKLEGVTMVIADNSGSAVHCGVSQKSKLRVSDAGNMLAAVLGKSLGAQALIGVFGDSMMWIPFSQADSCLSLKSKIDDVAQRQERSANHALAIDRFKHGIGVGAGTETGLWFAIDDLTKRHVHVDRMILLSDLCCYTQGDDGTAKNCGIDMEDYFGEDATVQSMVDRYRQVVNADCKVYSINLNGHTQSQTRPDEKGTHLLSGWSEKLVNTIFDLESDAIEASEDPSPAMTIDILQTRYRKVTTPRSN